MVTLLGRSYALRITRAPMTGESAHVVDDVLLVRAKEDGLSVEDVRRIVSPLARRLLRSEVETLFARFERAIGVRHAKLRIRRMTSRQPSRSTMSYAFALTPAWSASSSTSSATFWSRATTGASMRSWTTTIPNGEGRRRTSTHTLPSASGTSHTCRTMSLHVINLPKENRYAK